MFATCHFKPDCTSICKLLNAYPHFNECELYETTKLPWFDEWWESHVLLCKIQRLQNCTVSYTSWYQIVVK